MIRLRESLASQQRGQVAVMFALMIPMLLALAGVVIGIGNWYSHARHLQTKADAGALAGGSVWAFPCDGFIDTRIETEARAYAGPVNPQLGGVPNASITTVLNADGFYDNDGNPSPTEWISPPSNPSTAGALCNSKTLDVKVTEDDSFPLASLIPLFPDIKRKARVEIQGGDSITENLLPIAVRAPEPVSALAVFYDEQTGDVLATKYIVKKAVGGLFPPGLQGWSTENSNDLSTWAAFEPRSRTGVAIAISFRGACDTSLPPNPPANKTIQTSPDPSCLEDAYGPITKIADICNQPQAPTQIVNCYYATGNWPSEAVQMGLQFIRGYQDNSVAVGDPPAVEEAWLTSMNCTTRGVPSGAYFNAHPNTPCNAKLSIVVDVGDLMGMYVPPGGPPPPPPVPGDLKAQDIEVAYRLVRSDGSSFCNYGNTCELNGGTGDAPELTYETDGSNNFPHLPLTANSRGNAVAIQVRIKNATNHPNANCRGGNFSNNCRWFFTGNGFFGLSVPPTNAQILAAPIQRAFRGNSLTSSSVQWLRLTADPDCDKDPAVGEPIYEDMQAASQRIVAGENRCFLVDLGLKGGVALDANEEPVFFNDGVGPSQMGSLDCDPAVPQGQALIDSVINGCPGYGVHPFNWSPLCPTQNNIFNGYPTGNPGPPWNDPTTPWPPIRCVKTRPTGSMNQLERGLDNRLFLRNNAPCPSDTSTQWARGRNYWRASDNAFKGASYKTATTPNNIGLRDDPRLVTIFLVPTETFAGSGQNTYPVAGFIDIYIRGYGRISGNGSLSIDDPCPGSTPPSDLDLSGGSTGGYVLWGSIINHVHRGGGGTGNGELCRPVEQVQPCVLSLVE